MKYDIGDINTSGCFTSACLKYIILCYLLNFFVQSWSVGRDKEIFEISNYSSDKTSFLDRISVTNFYYDKIERSALIEFTVK